MAYRNPKPSPTHVVLKMQPILAGLLVTGALTLSSSHAQTSEATTNGPSLASGQLAPASRVATLSVADLREYESQSPPVKRLLANALALTALNLSYQYGSSDPKNGGMDCSGTVYYLLNQAGLKDVPRDSSGMYQWVWTRSRFNAVNSPNPDSFEFASLKPGDLLFWTGTYQIKRDPPVTHVMIYLGINRRSGRRVMVGASAGRQFEGKSRYGVSVFDFTLPRDDGTSTADLKPRFIGYGAIPGLAESDKSEPAGK